MLRWMLLRLLRPFGGTGGTPPPTVVNRVVFTGTITKRRVFTGTITKRRVFTEAITQRRVFRET